MSCNPALPPDEQTILIHLEERAGLSRESEAVRIGIPLPRAFLRDPGELGLATEDGVCIPYQGRALAFWPDRSIKWLQADLLADVPPQGRVTLWGRKTGSAAQSGAQPRDLVRLTERDDGIDVDTGTARFKIQRCELGSRGVGIFSSVSVGGAEALSEEGARLNVIDSGNGIANGVLERLYVEECGPIRAAVVAEGRFHVSGAVPLEFRTRSIFTAGSAAVCLECRIRNPQAALHAGGLWDLGDPGSVFIRDMTVSVQPRNPAVTLRWHAESPTDERDHEPAGWSIYQDSSGGEQWQSPNHIDHKGRSTVRFRGYEVRDASDAVLITGERASPVLCVSSADMWIACAVQDFWQNFPKALRWDERTLGIGLFPAESRGRFELQGGEQKRHTVWLEVGASGSQNTLAKRLRPLAACVATDWVARSGAIMWLSAASPHDDAALTSYLNQIVTGSSSFFNRREIIDEYGWRNYGDLYADHEAVRHSGPAPFVSHYNNQYDFVYGAFLNFQRTGDSRWRALMEDAARHHLDIDIYHTHADKPAFNGGLFWHTDHHQPAATATHRTYSGKNSNSTAYGGGPSNEHDYSSGLLHYYYLTGDREAAECVRELAEWVLAMDDGQRTLLGLIDPGSTGLASKTVDMSYQGPGRGAGNSINTLIDAYALTRERHYLAKAEEILQRCIHPAQDIDSLALHDPEHRWSYLVFLQVLGKYLATKQQLEELDYAYYYARASLLHFADWIVANEVPYKDVLHKVKLPTETWSAHDVRKCHVLHMAADCATGEQRARFRARATFFFQRCLADLLSFSTAHLTRPLVILCVYGWVHDYFSWRGEVSDDNSVHNHEFGRPVTYLPQRARWRTVLAARARAACAEVVQEANGRLHLLKTRLRRST